MKNILIFIFFISISQYLPGQETLLDKYIIEGLNTNHALRQKQIDYAISLSKLKESKSLFFPDIDINARYTVAKGGRVIEFPVGDLLNPVYNSLNMLTGSSQFPTIDNESFRFYRPKEHETKVTVIQPIFNSDLVFNYKINRELSEIAGIDIDIYKRELVKEIRKAYYNCCKSLSLLEQADTTILLVKENLRVSRRLYENDKVTIDAVYRSEAELSKAEAARARTVNYFESSRSYFNFLLNRPLETAFEPGIPEKPHAVSGLESAQEEAIKNRCELKKINTSINAGNYAVKMEKGNNIPDLTAVVDYGYQGEEYSFTSDDDFVLASVVLQWNLFQGMINKHKIEKRKLETQRLNELYSEAEKFIRMEVLNSYYSVLASYEEVEAARKQEASARKAYRVVKRKYEQGQANLLELIDARSAMTEANTGYITALSNYFINKADYDSARGAKFSQ